GHRTTVNGLPYLAGGGGATGPPTANGTVRAADGSAMRLTLENHAANGGFEDGTRGWTVEGGRLKTIASNNPSFGQSSLELTTEGTAPDEGFSSAEMPVSPGQTWRLSVWLKGTRGGEEMNVLIRQYDAGGAVTKQTHAPVTLSFFPTQYFVTTTITPPPTHLQAVVSTRRASQSVVI